MNLLKEITTQLKMEVRPNSIEGEYLEAVIQKSDLNFLDALLTKHLGKPVKEPGKEADVPADIQGLIDSMGGLRIGQSFFYKKGEGKQVIYAALWPWESNPEKITLKAGVHSL